MQEAFVVDDLFVQYIWMAFQGVKHFFDTNMTVQVETNEE